MWIYGAAVGRPCRMLAPLCEQKAEKALLVMLAPGKRGNGIA